MKSILITTAMVLTTSSAFAQRLACWDAFSKNKTPYMIATVFDDNTLGNIQFHPEQNADISRQEVDTQGPLQADNITTGHSPYQGYNSFALQGGATLILPTDLSPEGMAMASQGGFSRFDRDGDGINAVIIGYYQGEDSEAGSHYSVRMRCH